MTKHNRIKEASAAVNRGSQLSALKPTHIQVLLKMKLCDAKNKRHPDVFYDVRIMEAEELKVKAECIDQAA
jgi:hypothetical protein